MKTITLNSDSYTILEEIAEFHKTNISVMLSRLILEEYKEINQLDTDEEYSIGLEPETYSVADLSSPDFQENLNGHSIFHLDGKIYMVQNNEPEEITREEYFKQIRLEMDAIEKERELESSQQEIQERREQLNQVSESDLLAEGMEIISFEDDSNKYDGKFLAYGEFQTDKGVVKDYLIISKYRDKNNNYKVYRPSMNQLMYMLGKIIFGSDNYYTVINKYGTRKYHIHNQYGLKDCFVLIGSDNNNYKWCKLFRLDPETEMFTTKHWYDNTQKTADDIYNEEIKQCNREYYPLNELEEFPHESNYEVRSESL